MTKSKEWHLKINKMIADLIYNRASEVVGDDSKPSQTKIIEIIKKESNETVTRQYVARALATDLSKYLKVTNFEGNEKVKDIKEAMRVQKQIWINESVKPDARTKAANSWRGLQKQLIEYERQLADIELKKAEVARPIYKVEFGAFRTVEVSCPHCGKKFYHMPDGSKSEKEINEDG